MNDCCRTGFQWNGTPIGKEGTLAENKAYITGDSLDRAILFCHDALGWELNNTRLLADHFAKEVGATVYLPDFYHNDAMDGDKISIKVEDGKPKIETAPDVDFATWFKNNSPDLRMPEVVACAKQLSSQYSKLMAVGYCWGGSVNFKLASSENAGLFDCISVAHSGTPSEDEVRGIKVPFQIIAPEHDPSFPQEWREFCCKEIPKMGVDFHFQYFPGQVHGFCTKCDETDEKQKKALELAKNAVVYWFSNFT